ncbi:MAG: permease [Deltaproteobacteria bacterium]|nr:permease [Deltaproteobacteria bacterium]
MIKIFADWLTYSAFNMAAGTHLADAVNFFVYDTIKIILMLTVIIYIVSIIRSFFPPEKVKNVLAGKTEFTGNILASMLGIVTPFCSCSAVPVFIGFLEAGVPLGVTLSFLIASPMINEVALVLLWGLFGAKIALIYIGTGMVVAITAGFILGKIPAVEKMVEDYVWEIRMGEVILPELTWKDRFEQASDHTKDILKRVILYVILGIGVGAVIHGYAPIDFVAKYAGRDNPLAVPLAVLIAIPLYSNAAGTIPIVQALMGKGMPLGTVLAFMMAVTAISFPEMVILRKVLKVKLLVIFAAIMTVAIIMVGYLFNAII